MSFLVKIAILTLKNNLNFVLTTFGDFVHLYTKRLEYVDKTKSLLTLFTRGLSIDNSPGVGEDILPPLNLSFYI